MDWTKKRGRIIGGRYDGFLIRFEHDMEGSDSYLILTWREDDPKIGYDNWVESPDDVGPFLQEVGWNIEWLEE